MKNLNTLLLSRHQILVVRWISFPRGHELGRLYQYFGWQMEFILPVVVKHKPREQTTRGILTPPSLTQRKLARSASDSGEH